MHEFQLEKAAEILLVSKVRLKKSDIQKAEISVGGPVQLYCKTNIILAITAPFYYLHSLR